MNAEIAMNADSQAAIIANDLNSLMHRIEALPAHPEYTKALSAVVEAQKAILAGRGDLHEKAMRERFAKMDAA